MGAAVNFTYARKNLDQSRAQYLRALSVVRACRTEAERTAAKLDLAHAVRVLQSAQMTSRNNKVNAAKRKDISTRWGDWGLPE